MAEREVVCGMPSVVLCVMRTALPPPLQHATLMLSNLPYSFTAPEVRRLMEYLFPERSCEHRRP